MLQRREWDYYKDQLTALDNRFALTQYLKQHRSFHLFLFDIDNFSNINNFYSHLVGDELLRIVAHHLQFLAPKQSKVFKLEADTFVCLVEEMMSQEDMQDFCEMVLSFFNNTEIDLEQYSFRISVSIGAATGTSLDVLNQASLALRESRRFRKNNYKIYNENSEFIKKEMENIYWIGVIKEAIEQERIINYFQPIMNNNTGLIEKYECLARIEDDNNIIPPMQFMDACKLTGTFEYVTRKVTINAFKKFENTNLSFAINITSNDINLGYLEEFLMNQCKKFHIDPFHVTLELLEDIITLTQEGMMQQIENLRAYGFKIALDDFGMENSNFARLLELRPDYIKIDGAFIRDIHINEKNYNITKAIVELCKISHIQTVAEFVHSKEVSDIVKSLGVDFSQGYFVGKPQKDLLT